MDHEFSEESQSAVLCRFNCGPVAWIQVSRQGGIIKQHGSVDPPGPKDPDTCSGGELGCEYQRSAMIARQEEVKYSRRRSRENLNQSAVISSQSHIC